MGSKNLYFKNNYIMSFNYPILILIGGRGFGKTYSMLRYCVKQFLYKKRKFLILRATDAQVKLLCEDGGITLFADMKHAFKYSPEFELKNGNNIYINGEHAGTVMSVNNYYKYKGNVLTMYDIILYDEFMDEIVERNNRHKVRSFLNTLETVIRLNGDKRVILIANALKKGDPILNLFNLNIKDFGTYINKRKGCICIYAKSSVEYEKAHSESIVGRILEGTPYADNILYNKFVDDDFINYAPPQNATYLCSLHVDYGSVKVVMDEYLYVLEDDKKPHKNKRYCSDIRYVSDKLSLISRKMFDKLKECYANKNIIFQNANVKNIFMDFIHSYKK